MAISTRKDTLVASRILSMGRVISNAPDASTGAFLMCASIAVLARIHLCFEAPEERRKGGIRGRNRLYLSRPSERRRTLKNWLTSTTKDRPNPAPTYDLFPSPM